MEYNLFIPASYPALYWSTGAVIVASRKRISPPPVSITNCDLSTEPIVSTELTKICLILVIKTDGDHKKNEQFTSGIYKIIV